MRIISGYLRGRNIRQPNNQLTRPLKDLTKESIFNILKHSNLIMINLEKSKILDLFSGVGSFGLECLSREAKIVKGFKYTKAEQPIIAAPKVHIVVNKTVFFKAFQKYLSLYNFI